MSFGAAAQIICYMVYIVCNMLCVVYGRDLQNTIDSRYFVYSGMGLWCLGFDDSCLRFRVQGLSASTR